MSRDKMNWIALANQEPFTTVLGPVSGKEYQMREFTYGVLVPDKTHPLSCVSVSNSSISIDLWTGCAWGCGYCHVQGTAEDLVGDGKMAVKPQRRNSFSISTILDALFEHPFFVRHRSIISIGTASTEPFGSKEVTDSTFEIMREFVRRKLQNPFWIVTKAGFPKKRKQELANIIQNGNKVMISVCWADNPDSIEPVRHNRFANVHEAKEAGATISWYMRPIVSEWSGNEDKLHMMMLWVKKNYKDTLDYIVPGGLRWTEGIEYGLTEVRNLDMPDIAKDDNVKCLSDALWETILTGCNNYFPGVPVFKRSSCALSHMLGVPSIVSVQNKHVEDCESSTCSSEQRQICAKSNIANKDIANIELELFELGLDISIKQVSNAGKIVTEPPINSFTYAIQQTILKVISGLEENNVD